MSRWEAKKLELLRENMWQGDGGEGTSEMLQNPRKLFFLELVVVVHDVNCQECKKYKISYTRKAVVAYR